MIRTRLLLAFVMLLQAGVGPLSAQGPNAHAPSAAPAPQPATSAPVSPEPEATTATYGAWTLRCTHRQENGTSVHLCEVEQAVVPKGQQNPIAQVGLIRLSAKDALHISALVPTNITFQVSPKVTAQDKDPGVELTWRRCLPGGCMADALLSDDTLRAWRAVAADTGRLAFTDASGRKLAIQLSFRGFSQAMDALDKEHS